MMIGIEVDDEVFAEYGIAENPSAQKGVVRAISVLTDDALSEEHFFKVLKEVTQENPETARLIDDIKKCLSDTSRAFTQVQFPPRFNNSD